MEVCIIWNDGKGYYSNGKIESLIYLPNKRFQSDFLRSEAAINCLLFCISLNTCINRIALCSSFINL